MAHHSDFETNSLLLALLLLPLLYFILKQIKAIKPSYQKNIPPQPPGPAPLPILGNIFHLGKLPHVALADLATTYGPLVMLRLGTQYMVVGESPDAAVEILKTHDRVLSTRYVPNGVAVKRGQANNTSLVWSECNERWKSLRALCRTELFSNRALDTQSWLRERKVDEMVEHLRGKDKEVVNVGELVFVTGFNMLSNVMMSHDLLGFGEEKGEIKDIARKMMELAAVPNISDFYPIFANLDLQSIHKNSMKLLRRMQSAWEPIIKARRNAGVSPEHDFLDVLLRQNFADHEIHDIISELFTAGSDTSTSTIEWTMAELLRESECMRKLREELDREFQQERTIKEAALAHLPYLQACIKETLRLHPPTPLLLPRRAPKECQLMNYTIPRNARVFVNVWAIGRDPLTWNEPFKFKPERFLDSDIEYKGNNFEFLPFGAGRRICPGLPMAGRLIPLVLSSLVHFFDWSLPQGMDSQQLDMSEKYGLTLQREHPLLLIPKARR